MLLHAVLDSRPNLGDGLTYTTFTGYFGGTDATPNISWFLTAPVITTGTTSNLTSLDTATNNTFGNVDMRSLRLTGAFRARKTGVYRFFTTSDDASFIYIESNLVVSNGGTHAAQNRFGNFTMTAGSYYLFDIYYGESAQGQDFSAGFLEPNDDGTTSGSINTNDFIKDGTGLTVYYLTNWTSSSGTTNINTLTYNDASLQGRYKIDIIGLYVQRGNFGSSKDDLFYIESPQLYSKGSGTNFLVMHEEPVSIDFTRKDYHWFSEDFEVETELNGKIEMSFRRGVNYGGYPSFQKAMIVLQLEKLK